MVSIGANRITFSINKSKKNKK